MSHATTVTRNLSAYPYCLILSGEQSEGTFEVYDGPIEAKPIKDRILAELANGDRWANAYSLEGFDAMGFPIYKDYFGETRKTLNAYQLDPMLPAGFVAIYCHSCNNLIVVDAEHDLDSLCDTCR